MARGDHVFAIRLGGLYSHHAIDAGGGSVIHYTGPTGPASRVARTPFAHFAAGDDVRVRSYERFFATLAEPRDSAERVSTELRRALDRLRGVATSAQGGSPDAVVARAESRLGERRFDLVLNNCEHFASWCKTGLSESRQVEAIWSAALDPFAFRKLKLGDKLSHWLDPFELWLRR